MELDRLLECSGFQWDEGNAEKNWIRHRVSLEECDQVFLNRPLVVSDDPRHSQVEQRYFALGQTDTGRGLLVVFTIRADLIRVISARDMSRAERRTVHEEDPDI